MMRSAIRRLASVFWEFPPWTPPRTFDFGGTWGDSIQFFGAPERPSTSWRVVGWKTPRPAVNDALRVPMKSGRIMLCRFVEVSWCHDPDDMFFATVEPVRYEP